MSVVVSIKVESDKGVYQPGTAIVQVNGETHASLRGGESYEITVHDPEFSTRSAAPATTEQEER